LTVNVTVVKQKVSQILINLTGFGSAQHFG